MPSASSSDRFQEQEEREEEDDDDDAEQDERGEEVVRWRRSGADGAAAVELVRYLPVGILREVFFHWAFGVHRFDRRDVNLALFAELFYDRLV